MQVASCRPFPFKLDVMIQEHKQMASQAASADSLQRVLSLASPMLQGPVTALFPLLPIAFSGASTVTSALQKVALQAIGVGPAMWLLPALYVSKRVRFGTSENAGLKALQRAAKAKATSQPLGTAAASRLASRKAKAQVVAHQQAKAARLMQRGKLTAFGLSTFPVPQLVSSSAAPAAAAAAHTREWVHAAAGLQASML